TPRAATAAPGSDSTDIELPPEAPGSRPEQRAAVRSWATAPRGLTDRDGVATQTAGGTSRERWGAPPGAGGEPAAGDRRPGARLRGGLGCGCGGGVRVRRGRRGAASAAGRRA